MNNGKSICGPSTKHQWASLNRPGGSYACRCKRCGSMWCDREGGTAALFCHPTPAWLAENPDDDRKER